MTDQVSFDEFESSRTYGQRLILSLAIPAYRWLWLSTVFGTMRLITVFIARGWLVLLLTDSPFWVGLAVAVRGVIHIAVGTFAGVLLDRLNRRRMLIAAEVGTSLTALGAGVLVLTGRIELWHILVVSMLEGIFVAFRWPALNTMIYEVVGSKRLLNASASQMLGFNLGNIVASALAGQLIEVFGIASGYFFAAGCGLFGTFLLFFVRGSFRPQISTESFRNALRSGLSYIWNYNALKQLMALSFIMALLGYRLKAGQGGSFGKAERMSKMASI